MTIFQTNGGFALMIAAESLAPAVVPSGTNPWNSATPLTTPITSIPSSFSFTGSGVALFGTLGPGCPPTCENGHVHVLIDGKQMVDLTGIWQRKTLTAAIPDALLFAWRWPTSGSHMLQFQFQAGDSNPKEGDAFISIQRELIIP